jgi:hypothetical protein
LRGPCQALDTIRSAFDGEHVAFGLVNDQDDEEQMMERNGGVGDGATIRGGRRGED